MRITLAVIVGLAALLVPGTAAAAPPANDDFANATSIASLPFSDAVSIVEATSEGGENNYCAISNTVWYSFVAADDAVIRVDPSGTNFTGPVFNVFRQDGSGIGGLSFVGCSNFGSSMTFAAQAGETYYIKGGSAYWGPGELHLNISVVPPPANDDIADATSIGGLPYSNTVDVTGATMESGEPTPTCVGYLQTGTAWYSYTPSESGSLMATGDYYNTIAAYSGSPGNLTEVGCWNFGHPITFHADAGTTYYFQLAGIYGIMSVRLGLQVTPPPVASIGMFISDPSSFDTIGFYDQSSDPGQVGFASAEWDFGDGGTASNPGCCPSHRYFADGDYTVHLTVTTTDGRSASTTRIVQVRTHDVAVAKMTVPQSASVGQNRSIVVGLSNRRYAETVRIDLFRSTPGGFVQFASSTQAVPVRGGNKTSDFSFNYTFTQDDQALGKVTFKAIATIVSARDALLTDNEAISLPTKVR
jgi:PKD domain